MEFVHTRRVQEDVFRYETDQEGIALEWLLAPCTEQAIDAKVFLNSPMEFMDGMYYFVRRVEAAAHRYQVVPDVPARDVIVRAADAVRNYIPRLAEKLDQVEHMDTNTPLEEIGKAVLLDRLRWAEWVLNECLPQWGY